MPFPKLFYYYRYRLTGEKATPNSQKINLAFFFLPNAKLGGEGRMRAVQHLEAPLFLRPLLWSWGAPTGCRWGAGGTPNLAAWCQYSRRVLVGPGAPPAPRHLGGPAMQKQETLCWGRTGLGGTGRNWVWGQRPGHVPRCPSISPAFGYSQRHPKHPWPCTLGPRGPLGGRCPALPRLPWGQEMRLRAQ